MLFSRCPGPQCRQQTNVSFVRPPFLRQLRGSYGPAQNLWQLFGTDHLGREVGIRLLKSLSVFPGVVGPHHDVFGGVFGAVGGYATGLLKNIIMGYYQYYRYAATVVFMILVCTILSVIMLIAFVAGILACQPSQLCEKRLSGSLVGLHLGSYRTQFWCASYSALSYSLVQTSAALGSSGELYLWLYCVSRGGAYLGDYGVQEPPPSWGNMIAQAKNYALMMAICWP